MCGNPSLERPRHLLTCPLLVEVDPGRCVERRPVRLECQGIAVLDLYGGRRHLCLTRRMHGRELDSERRRVSCVSVYDRVPRRVESDPYWRVLGPHPMESYCPN